MISIAKETCWENIGSIRQPMFILKVNFIVDSGAESHIRCAKDEGFLNLPLPKILTIKTFSFEKSVIE